LLAIIQTADGFQRRIVVCHFDETEAFTSTSVTIHDYLGATDRAVLSEPFFQLRSIDAVAQIAYIKFLTHNTTPSKHCPAQDKTDPFRLSESKRKGPTWWSAKWAGERERAGRTKKCVLRSRRQTN
jgi:hypothetical protein